MSRAASIKRRTNETQISISVDLDNANKTDIQTGVGFLDHMLEQIARHAHITLKVCCQGDTYIDDHHTTEDVGIAIGQTIAEAIADKQGIQRYGYAYCPLDEALSRAVIDLSGRPGLHYFADFPTEKIGTFDTQLIREFFQGFANHALITIHLESIRGTNSHHIAETLFKAFARALRQAISLDEKSAGIIPSTKGVL